MGGWGMSYQAPEMGPVQTPGTVPAVGPIEPEGLGMNLNPLFEAVRTQVAPFVTGATKLKLKLAQAKARQMEAKRQEDSLIMPTILQDIQRNQERMQDISMQIEAFNAKMSMPFPKRVPAQLDKADMYATGIAALFGGNQGMSQAHGALMQGAEQRADIDFQNQVGEFQYNRENIMRQMQLLQRQMDVLEGRDANLEERVYREQVREDENELELYKFEESNALKESDDELALKREDRLLNREDRILEENRADSLNREIRNLLAQFGQITPEVAARLEARREKLLEAGVPEELLDQVPGGKTMRREDMEADNKRADDAAKRKAVEFDKRYAFMEKQHRDRMAALAAQRAISKEKGDKPSVDKATVQLLKEAKGHKQRVRAEVSGIKDAIATAKANPDWGGFEREEKLAKLHSDLSAKESELKEWNQIIGEYEAIQGAESPGSTEGKPGVDWREMSKKAVEAIRSKKVDPAWVRSEYERLTGRKANF